MLHTLEPLVYIGPAEGKPREEWQLRPAADLLKLTVCDMAMGSGAFLVQACRYLSERLLEAWAAAENSRKDAKTQSMEEEPSAHDLGGFAPLREPTSRRLITPEGFSATNPDEIIPADPDERLVFARLVADRCLYGVDKNPLAVEMAKLSLWLITLAKGQPFSFLDHALRCGDSLLGISEIGQLTHWSLDKGDGAEERQTTFITRQVEEALEVALRERRKIAGTRVREARDADLKAGWLATADAAMALVKLGADLLVASALHPNPKQREGMRNEWLMRYSLLLSAAEETRAGRLTVGGQADTANRVAYAALRHEADKFLAGRKPFHWPLEYPEVFVWVAADESRKGFEQILNEAKAGSLNGELVQVGFATIVGNPPFVGGRRIRETLGDDYRDGLYELFSGSSGNADLSAFFFLRGFQNLKRGGDLGLIATNTIAQGDTRQTGLDPIIGEGGTIYYATNNQLWPGLAAVIVSIVHIAKGHIQPPFLLDGNQVDHISGLLEGSRVTRDPHRLASNSEQSYMGSNIIGIGFAMPPEDARALIFKDPRNADVLFPFLVGQDFNTSPVQEPSRWVINFWDWPLERADTYPECMKIVREKVKPLRDEVNRKVYRDLWWQFGEKQKSLYEAIRPLRRVLVIALTSRTAAFAFTSKDMVFSHAAGVFAFEEPRFFAVLQSAFHVEWAWSYGSSLKGDLRYTPTDIFETFPFPTTLVGLDFIGEEYHEHRRQIMLARQEGLTKTYNRFHDRAETSADIAELRRLHVEMDQAVAAAYGWADLDLGHGFHETKQGLHYTIGEAARREVLALGEGHSPGRAAGHGQGKWTAWSKARCFGFA